MTNAQKPFDVFLAHNSLDKLKVREIAQQLKQRGLTPWLDDEQIPPGQLFQDAIQKAIPQVKSAAIFVGLKGLGSWQIMELRTFISSCVKNHIPVIPILLPGVSSLPEGLLFLEHFRWVEFAQEIDDASALNLLEWGITGRKPETTAEHGNKPGRVPEEQHLEEVETILKLSDDLSSDRNVDYTQLRNLLAAGNWKDADYETYLVMLRVVGRELGDWIRPEELLNFPCTDLRTIDSLWVKYSNGRFGFSVQKNIYLKLGGKPDEKYYKEGWDKFGDHVGWRVNQNWIYYSCVIYDIIAPVGHLPWVRLPNQWISFSSLASKLVNCSR
ncbi:MAG: GUN4 domain-containing protein [Scytonema sp. PMC 1069.18]|nr:GUN4 domain-containing protein [Scytonema sp. PMC 1069.18]MEC4881605.1 GUN4 domain-containing protein [Scytonema sp. PMC 1070.18]